MRFTFLEIKNIILFVPSFPLFFCCFTNLFLPLLFEGCEKWCLPYFCPYSSAWDPPSLYMFLWGGGRVGRGSSGFSRIRGFLFVEFFVLNRRRLHLFSSCFLCFFLASSEDGWLSMDFAETFEIWRIQKKN